MVHNELLDCCVEMGKKFSTFNLHRHFDMSVDEVLVLHGSTWDTFRDDVDFIEGRIVPRK
jgi:hypothetical protein